MHFPHYYDKASPVLAGDQSDGIDGESTHVDHKGELALSGDSTAAHGVAPPPPGFESQGSSSLDSVARKAGEGQKDFLKVEMHAASDEPGTSAFKIGDDDYKLKTELKFGADSKIEHDLKLEGDYKSDIKLEVRNYGEATNHPAEVNETMGHSPGPVPEHHGAGAELFNVKLEHVVDFPDDDDGPGTLVHLQPEDSVEHLLDPGDIDHHAVDHFDGHGDVHDGAQHLDHVDHSEVAHHLDGLHDIEL